MRPPVRSSDSRRRGTPLRLWLSCAAMMVALAGSGCGGGHTGAHRAATSTARSAAAAPKAPPVCAARDVAAVARALRVSVSAIRTRVTRDNSNQPECVFEVRRVRLAVSVSSEPQPYAVLERQAEEEAQIFGAKRFAPPPVHVPHLGIDAYWFPEEQELLTTDAVHLITARILRGGGLARQRWPAVTAQAARPYLGKPNLSLARGPAPCDCGTPTSSSSSASS